MLFFKTIDVTVPIENVSALSRQGSTLYIYLYGQEKPIQSKPEGDWELEEYTQQWADLRAEQEAIHAAERAAYRAEPIMAPGAAAVKVPQGNLPSKADYVDPAEAYVVNGS